MKKQILISLTLFSIFSCQDESISGIDESSNRIENIPSVSNKFSARQTTVLAESSKINILNVEPSNYYGVTYGSNRLILDLQADGNLIFKVVRLNSDGSTAGWQDLWTSNTGNRFPTFPTSNRYLAAQNDGNLVLYEGNSAYWNAGTYTGTNIQNPVIKIQFIKVSPTFNSGSPRYYGKLILEGNGQDRKVIAEGEFNL